MRNLGSGLKVFWRRVLFYFKGVARKLVNSDYWPSLTDFFREFSTFSTVVLIAGLIIIGNLSQRESGDFSFGFKKEKRKSLEEKVQERVKNYSYGGSGLTSAPLAIASSAKDIQKRTLQGEKLKQNEIQYQVLTATEPNAEELLKSGSDVAVYEVKEGDTVSEIAKKFGITVNTILWANDISDVSKIKPGDKIFILPVTGVKHKVAASDTIEKIAKRYKADPQKIIAFNGLPADGKLKVGEEIIIPDGQKTTTRRLTPETVLRRRSYYALDNSSVGKSTKRKPSIIDRSPHSKGRHRFPYGQCTWYVAQHKYVPWGGNAGTWLYHARAYGAKTGKTPKVGAIVVTSESWYGHVAIVTKVTRKTIRVKEMNYKGWAKVSSRTIPRNSRVIKGYIY